MRQPTRHPVRVNPDRFTPAAIRQIDELRRHYVEKNRIEALRNLLNAIEEAQARILKQPAAGLPAPGPYPDLAHDA